MKNIFDHLVGAFAWLLFGLNCVTMTLLILLLTFLKFIIPLKFWRKNLSLATAKLGENWISFNNFNIWLTQSTKWPVNDQVLSGCSPKKSYLVVANHQSWVDIVALQKNLNRKIPFLRFFIKKQLAWVPFLGQAWWALDFPMVARTSKAELSKNPAKAKRDIEMVRKCCDKFKEIPTSILVFAEGTRFKKEKHTNSQFKNLLPPKTGGVLTALQSMGEQFSELIDVTIFYPQKEKQFWQLFAKKIPVVAMKIKRYEIPKEILNPETARDQAKLVKKWLNEIWAEKDLELNRMINGELPA